MFAHVYKYRLKCLLRDKELVFWTLLFSLLLATLFYFAFSGLTVERELFKPIAVAILDTREYRENTTFGQMLASLAEEGDGQMLILRLVESHDAEKLLDDGAITGIISAGRPMEPATLTVRQSGLQESILKAILDEYGQTEKLVADIVKNNPTNVARLINDLQSRSSYIEEVSFSNAVPDTMLAYFYALIAMACMYSGFWGLKNSSDVQADLSPQGARRSVAPTHKLKVVTADALAALTISFGEVLVLVAYLVFVLKINFGHQIVHVLLTCLVGCVAGISLGNFFGTVLRASEGLKTGLFLGASMVMSFLAGLMFVNMKHIVRQKAPFLSYVNPAALISDAFYTLYVFDNNGRFYVNIGMLLLISGILCAVSFSKLRRERYASI